MGVHCDHTVHVIAGLSSQLDSPMFWTPWHQAMSYSQPSFSSSTWTRGGVWLYKLGVISQERLKTEVQLPLSANGKSYMPRRLAQHWMTLSDLECTLSALKSSSALHAISAVAEVVVITSCECIQSRLSVCLSVCLSCLSCNFQKPWHRNFVFGTLYILRISESHYCIKVIGSRTQEMRS